MTSSKNLHQPWFVKTVELWFEISNSDLRPQNVLDKGTVRFCLACFHLSFLEGKKNTKENTTNQGHIPNDHRYLRSCTPLAQEVWSVPQAVPSSAAARAALGWCHLPASIRARGGRKIPLLLLHKVTTYFPPVPGGTSRLQSRPAGTQLSETGSRRQPARGCDPAALQAAPAGCPGPLPASSCALILYFTEKTYDTPRHTLPGFPARSRWREAVRWLL